SWRSLLLRADSRQPTANSQRRVRDPSLALRACLVWLSAVRCRLSAACSGGALGEQLRPLGGRRLVLAHLGLARLPQALEALAPQLQRLGAQLLHVLDVGDPERLLDVLLAGLEQRLDHLVLLLDQLGDRLDPLLLELLRLLAPERLRRRRAGHEPGPM